MILLMFSCSFILMQSAVLVVVDVVLVLLVLVMLGLVLQMCLKLDMSNGIFLLWKVGKAAKICGRCTRSDVVSV